MKHMTRWLTGIAGTGLLCACAAQFGARGGAEAGAGSGGSGGGTATAGTGGGEGAGPSAQAGPPGNWSLQEREAWIKLQEELDGYVAQTNQKCGTQIAASFVHESFRGRLTESGYGLDGYTRATCAAPVTALSNVCDGGDMQKQAVRERITRVECAWGQTAFALDSGTFRVTINTTDDSASGYEYKMIEWVKKQL